MKALVIRQPWAELIVSGRKTIEVRRRRTNLQEEFLIVAGGTPDIGPDAVRGYAELGIGLAGLFCGFAVGIARIYKCEEMDYCHQAAAMVSLEPGDWAWHLGNVRRVAPFRVRGMPGFFNVDLAEAAHGRP